MILYNEILHSNDIELVYKTLSIDCELYGMFSTTRGTINKPSFLHIFNFEGDKAVVINKKEEYKFIDSNGFLSEMDVDTEDMYKCFILKNSKCNCFNSVDIQMNCNTCNGRGQIENKFSDRQFAKLFGWEK